MSMYDKVKAVLDESKDKRIKQLEAELDDMKFAVLQLEQDVRFLLESRMRSINIADEQERLNRENRDHSGNITYGTNREIES